MMPDLFNFMLIICGEDEFHQANIQHAEGRKYREKRVKTG